MTAPVDEKGRAVCPVQHAPDLIDPETFENGVPADFFAEVRDAAPVYWHPQAGAHGDGRYRLSGERALRPTSISDDGTHTYIAWPDHRALPAVYTFDAQGHEALVNGNMRGNLYVLDSVQRRLVFRIDRHVARAVRTSPIGMP